ncbi:Helitron helicase [Phytophthora megakarya]|uniref:ATP-dependent DNA helicase n=1 Tax=Phytophthora megakarya TaxID=4795 RepID=A0A225ULC7_9STRA|nr:Helitron helicase [Phytophthora megakarya]
MCPPSVELFMYRHKILVTSIFGFYFAIVVLPSQDDQEWSQCLTEAAAEKMLYQLCQLFAIVLVYSLPTRPDKVWEEFKAQMWEEFVRNFEEKDAAENIHREGEVRARMAEYKALKYRTPYLASNGKTLEVYGLPELRAYSDVSAALLRQTDLEHVTERIDQLNRNQRDVFDQVVRAVEHPMGGEKLFFLDGPGGTGKSFLLEPILGHVRSQRKIAIAVASSGIAATLLTGGIPHIPYSSQTNRAVHMQSFLTKSKGGTDPKRQINYLG